MDRDTNLDEKFNFMLKEYEMNDNKFEMHYTAVEKTITVFFIIIASIISANGFLLKKPGEFNIFFLTDFQVFSSLFISLIGFITTLKVMEHRILIIKYVKSLNLIRRWFWDKLGHAELSKYSIFKATYESPRYYSKYSHFFWEIFGLASINSVFISTFLINISIKIFNLSSDHYKTINWIWFILLVFLFSFSSTVIYRKRGEKEEKKIMDMKLLPN
jgi:hypothetical protein